jgi:hypothetical protein
MPLAMEPLGRAARKCNVLLHFLTSDSAKQCPERATFLRQVYYPRSEQWLWRGECHVLARSQGVHLVMGGASGLTQLGTIPHSLQQQDLTDCPDITGDA